MPIVDNLDCYRSIGATKITITLPLVLVLMVQLAAVLFLQAVALLQPDHGHGPPQPGVGRSVEALQARGPAVKLRNG